MRVQLNKRWASYLPGQIVSVSDERGVYLIERLKIGRDIDGVLKKAKKALKGKK